MKEFDETESASASTGVSAEERHRLISEAAYYRAEHRGFIGGYDLEDWLDSEAQIDEMLSAEKTLAKTQQA